MSTDDDLVERLSSGPTVKKIPVQISYEIIRLFSEGLYQSPQKAVEELVSNSYDANASSVHILLPEPGDSEEDLPPLWVIDDGHGMTADGFTQLWRVADSEKSAKGDGGTRPPIGQFGIGKLASYVLAWRLTHLSKAGGKIRMTSMNFRKLEDRHQYDELEPFRLGLAEVSEEEAKTLLAEIERRDPLAWKLLFGKSSSKTWTVARLSDFKSLYEKLSKGRLSWSLRTGLPLKSDFSMYLDGEKLISSKEQRASILTITLGSVDDTVAEGLGFTKSGQGVVIPGISGVVSGIATIYQNRLTDGKSDQYGRSHGFFVRVRGRVINLSDELFGLDALNHSSWSRFVLEVEADGLRDLLLSSREGVRETDAIFRFRKYLHGIFNLCRRAYDDWAEKEIAGLDLESLLRDAPSLYITEPVIGGVRRAVQSGQESFYVSAPDIPEGDDREAWVDAFAADATESPVVQVLYESTGKYDRALHYVPDGRTLVMNTDHPFVDKLISSSRNRGTATLFGSAELMLDLLLQEHGLSPADVIDLLENRDRVLRLLAGDHPSTAAEVLRLLDVANRNETALERAVGAAFRVLGFEYERRGGNIGGTDGVLYARLGRGSDSLADYKVVYDAKQTSHPTVPADKIDISSLDDFRRVEDADFSFFLAVGYAAESQSGGKLNRKVIAATTGKAPVPLTMLRLKDLRRIVELHYRFGVTLTRLRSLFAEAHTVPQVETWVQALEDELANLERQVPLQRLLDGIEDTKLDELARPNVYTVRATDPALKQFEPERLITALQAVETIVGRRWLEVEKSGDVRLHHTASQIVAEVERHLLDLFGVDALPTSARRAGP